MAKILKGIKNEITLKATARVMGDMGKEDPVDFKLTFKRIHDPKKVMQLFNRAASGEIEDLDVMRDYLIGWEGIEFDDGAPVECNEENLELVMSVREYKDAIVNGFTQVQLGYGKLQAKN
jgi:hypothetical protein